MDGWIDGSMDGFLRGNFKSVAIRIIWSLSSL